MRRPLKIALGATAIVVALFIVATLYAVFFFDANNYRNEIAAQVKAATGRSFHIGSIHLSFLPVLGLKLDDAVLGNPKGFSGAPFAKVSKAAVGVRLWPLIMDHRLEISSIYLSGLDLALRRKTNGKANWDGMLGVQPGEKPALVAPRSQKSGGPPLWSVFAVAGVRVENASIRYEDAARDRSVLLAHVDLSAGPLRSGKPCPFRISFVTQSSRPALTAEVNSSGELTADFSAHYFSLHDYRLRVVTTGPSVPAGRQSIALHGNADYNSAKALVEFKRVTFDLAGVTSRVSGRIRQVGMGQPVWEATLHVDPFNPSDALGVLGVRDYYPKDASVLKKASLSAQASGSLHQIKLMHLNLHLDQTKVSGSASVRVSAVPVVAADLRVDNLNVDRYLPIANARNDRSTATGSPRRSAGPRLPIPLTIFRGVVGRCHLTVQRLIVHGMKLSHASVGLNVAPHGTATATLNAGLYGGKIVSRTRIGAIGAREYRQSFLLTHVSIGPLLRAFSGSDPVSGQGDVHAELTSTGQTVLALVRNLNGSVSVHLKNGAVRGFNLGAIVRSLKNLSQLNDQSVLSGVARKSQETDFSSLSASGHVSNGILTSNNLTAASPFLRASGAGKINLVKRTIDYMVYPVLVNTATGQNGKRLNQLHGVEIPVRITGRLSAPRYEVALGALLRRVGNQGLRQLLNKRNTTLHDRLKRLFGF